MKYGNKLVCLWRKWSENGEVEWVQIILCHSLPSGVALGKSMKNNFLTSGDDNSIHCTETLWIIDNVNKGIVTKKWRWAEAPFIFIFLLLCFFFLWIYYKVSFGEENVHAIQLIICRQPTLPD